jgi:hypothetical protein
MENNYFNDEGRYVPNIAVYIDEQGRDGAWHQKFKLFDGQVIDGDQSSFANAFITDRVGMDRLDLNDPDVLAELWLKQPEPMGRDE